MVQGTHLSGSLFLDCPELAQVQGTNHVGGQLDSSIWGCLLNFVASASKCNTLALRDFQWYLAHRLLFGITLAAMNVLILRYWHLERDLPGA